MTNRNDRIFRVVGIGCTFVGLFLLALFLTDIIRQGAGRLSLSFLTSLPSRFPERAGIYTALIGSFYILAITALLAVPVGIGAGLYLEEYTKKNWLATLVEINILNLAGIPSIIYGLLGLGLFVQALHWGSSVLSAAATLALLVLPTIIVSTREAVKAVPNSIREGSYGLGATHWQTVWFQVLPAAAGGITTGAILALLRAIGEAAPLVAIGVLAYVPFAPTSLFDAFSALPTQIFNWIDRPQAGFKVAAAAAIIVLLTITFLLNGSAIYLRSRWQKNQL
ncbi:MAG: phosphate ABC transporter permease PstA [Bacteroidetes bacterium]|nr:phosphate ABC transporter permease PstA [Fibrella sp.]